MNSKLVIICGPTATGKTALALRLAVKFDGEIVSADSRQIYTGMDIGTGKELPVNSKFSFATTQDRQIPNSKFRMKGDYYHYGYYIIDNVRVWGLDIAKPNQEFSISHYASYAGKVIGEIIKRGKLPILTGGSGLYIKSLTKPLQTLDIPRDENLRQKLAPEDSLTLQHILQKKDRDKWLKMNNSDRNNPRRLIRAIEVANYKEINKIKSGSKNQVEYDPLVIGLKTDEENINRRIGERVDRRIQSGIIGEIKGLLKKGYKWNLPSMSTLGYAQWKEYFEGKETVSQVIRKWKSDEQDYAKRQMTWFKKMKSIKWFDIAEADYIKEIEKIIEEWYT